jgi:hypothetical protein
MTYWQLINQNIFEQKYNVVYIGIGCSMSMYDTINESNNQQCPCFLNKFENKLIILFDPELEKPLKTESVLYELETVSDQDYRILKNLNTIIYAINENLYYELEHIDEKYKIKTENDIPSIYNIISLCISNNIKFIMQDYTGRDTQNFYLSLFNLFDKNELLNNVFFDVTEKDSGCRINLHSNQAPLVNNKFIQNKYMKLVDMISYTDHIKSRIDKLKYPLAWVYIQYKENPSFLMFGYNDIKFLCFVYDIEYNEKQQQDRIYILGKLHELIKSMIEDIVTVKKESFELSKYLLTEAIYNRNAFNNALTELYKKL